MSTRIRVDGEEFEYSMRETEGSWSIDLTWLTGKNPGYGFSSGTPSGTPPTDEQIRAWVRNFLEIVDPHTGYIE